MKITETTVEISRADYALLRQTAELAFVMVMDQAREQSEREPESCQKKELKKLCQQQIRLHKQFVREFPKIDAV